MIKTIYTHCNVDLDAASSSWAAKTFIPDAKDACIEFRPADWNGDGVNRDECLLLDLRAGIKGEQDSDGRVHSCFAQIVRQYASASDQEALKHLVDFIDMQDAYGSVVEQLIPDAPRDVKDLFGFTGLNAIFRAIQSQFRNNDLDAVRAMSEIFSGMLKTGRARQRAVEEAKKMTIYDGRVAIVRDSREYGTNGVLFSDYGVRAIVYVDGDNLGIIMRREETIRTDHEVIRAIIADAGEETEWFAHPSGFLYCRGSRKAPANSPSKVDPGVLAQAVLSILP